MFWIWAFILLAVLTVLIVYDVREFRLPDMLTLPLIGLGVIASFSLGQKVWISLLGGGVGYLIFLALELGYKQLRGTDGLGRGDAKLFAAGGTWCGIWALPFIALTASLCGLIWIGVWSLFTRKSVKKIAFGPFLALGIFSTFLALKFSGYAL